MTSKKKVVEGDSANPFRELAEILGALNPRCRAGEKAALEDDAPLWVRRVWEAVGISDAIQETAFRFWTRAESEDALAKTFEGWSESPKARAALGKTAEAMRGKLPAKIRLVSTPSDDLAVIDESTGADDPPVLLMRSEEREVLTWCPSYREWLVWHLVTRFTSTRFAGYNRRVELPSTPVLAEAYPTGMHRLAEGIWWMAIPALSEEAGIPTVQTKVFYASMEAYSAFALALPDDKLPFMMAPAGDVFWTKNAGKVDLLEAPPEGFRRTTHIGYDGKVQKSARAVGRVGSTIVWVGSAAEKKPDDVRITFNPQGREAVSKWVKSLALKVTPDIPLQTRAQGKRVSYDYYGW
jgi:hypothetical protein